MLDKPEQKIVSRHFHRQDAHADATRRQIAAGKLGKSYGHSSGNSRLTWHVGAKRVGLLRRWPVLEKR